MPKYKITDNQTGKTVIISGDSPPTEQDAEGIFQQAGLRNTQSTQSNSNPVTSASNFLNAIGLGAVPGAAATLYEAPGFVQRGFTPRPIDTAKKDNPFLTDQKARSIKLGGSEAIKEPLREAAGLASYAVPMGKGPLLARVGLNALTGGLNEASQIDATPKSVLTSGAMSAGIGLGMEGVGKIANKVGESLAKTGESLGMKRFGLTKLDKYNFEKKFGQAASDFIKEKGLVGQDVAGAKAIHDTLQNSFDDIAQKSGLKVETQDLVSSLVNKAEDMAKDPSPAIRNKGEIVKQYANNLMDYTKGAKSLDVGDVTKLRMNVDDLTNFGKSGADADAYRAIRDVLQGKVRDVADSAGMKGAGGKSLTEMGKDLNKLKTFLGMAEKRDPALSSKQSLGLIKSILLSGFGTGGAVLGGLPGFLGGLGAGAVADTVVNNPNVVKGTSKALSQTGGNIQRMTTNKLLNDLLLKAGQISGAKLGGMNR